MTPRRRHDRLADDPDNSPTAQQVLTFKELAKIGVSQGEMSETLNEILSTQLGGSNPADALVKQYNNVIKNPAPNEPGA